MNVTPNSIGSTSSNTIAVKYRGIDPSFIGNIDTNVCGSSDPGSSGVLTPFTKVQNLYFDTTPEDQDGIFELEKELAVMNRKIDESREILIELLHEGDTHEDYIKRQEMIVETNNMITFSR